LTFGPNQTPRIKAASKETTRQPIFKLIFAMMGSPYGESYRPLLLMIRKSLNKKSPILALCFCLDLINFILEDVRHIVNISILK